MDICTCFHSYSLFRAFSSPCVSVNTLSLSRVDIVISRSGSPHDASHLPSIVKLSGRDFLFFARNDVFCDLLQYRSIKSEIYSLYIIKKFNEATPPGKKLLKYITPPHDVICACVLRPHLHDATSRMRLSFWRMKTTADATISVDQLTAKFKTW